MLVGVCLALATGAHAYSVGSIPAAAARHAPACMAADSSPLTVGVLAIQGGFEEHVLALKRQTGVEAVEVRTPYELLGCDALILPGGESTAQGHCIVEALRTLGARTIAVSNGYYRDDWRDGINHYLTQAGFEILSRGHMRDQGLYASLEEQVAVEEATVWDHPDRDVLESIRLAHAAAPTADAVVQTGSGFRTAPHLAGLEAECGKPVVASDGALYWAMLRELDLGDPVAGRGALLESL